MEFGCHLPVYGPAATRETLLAFARRGAWSDEALRIMRACWREERPSFRGEFVSFAPVGFAPKPPHGTIPVWIGGHTPRALRRVAELGDGWHAAFTSAEKMKGGL